MAVVIAAVVSGTWLWRRPDAEAILAAYKGSAHNDALVVEARLADGPSYDLVSGVRGRLKEKWNPRSLPQVSGRADRPSRVGVAIELIVDAVFVTWWTAVHRSTDLLLMPPILELGPAWPAFYLPVLLVVLASMAVKCVVLVRPDWTVFRLNAGLLVTAAGVGVAALVLRAGPLVVPGQSGPEARQLALLLNSVLRWSIGVAVVITILTTALEFWRWNRVRRRA